MHPIRIKALQYFLGDLNWKLEAGKKEIADDEALSKEVKARSAEILVEQAAKARPWSYNAFFMISGMLNPVDLTTTAEAREVAAQIDVADVERLRGRKLWWPSIDADKAIAEALTQFKEQEREEARAQAKECKEEARARRQEREEVRTENGKYSPNRWHI
ncbi:hypothetical protein BGZ68_002780 [Mortierella alpina]|nr:hypothetical protein BGZ68_002780 [Mortierella alpina]